MTDFYIAVLLTALTGGATEQHWMESRYLSFPTREECLDVLSHIESSLKRWVAEQWVDREHGFVKFDCITLEEKVERNDALEGI